MRESWTEEMEAQLATELVAIHRDSYGKGAAEVGVLVSEDTIVVSSMASSSSRARSS